MRVYGISFFHAVKNVLLGRSNLFGIGAPIALGALLFISLLFLFLGGHQTIQENQEKGVLIGEGDTGNSPDTNKKTQTINGQCTEADSTSDSIQRKSIEP
ncbi:MAG: hypothetical protein WC894_05475 [Patescibacteria group bacterium]